MVTKNSGGFRTIRRLSIVIALSLIAIEAAFLGNVRLTSANPAITHGRYVGWTGSIPLSSPQNFTDMGCARASAGEIGAFVLAFGAPYYQSGVGYETVLPGTLSTYMTLYDIQIRAQNFAYGYYSCAPAGAFASIIISTSNSGSYLTSGHGSQWSTMVSNVQNWITSPPSYGSKVAAYAGFDAEPGFNSYSSSASWLQNYSSSYTRRVYDVGSADGCPESWSGSGTWTTGQTSTAGACQNGWNQDNVSYIAWGNPAAWPFPEIYTNSTAGTTPLSSQAIQWQRITNYRRLHYGSAMQIGGILTQQGACIDNQGTVNQCASGTTNSPTDGYNQLWTALNYLDAGAVAQTPNWLSDISWKQ